MILAVLFGQAIVTAIARALRRVPELVAARPARVLAFEPARRRSR